MAMKDMPRGAGSFEASEITKDYSGVPVLLGVSLTLHPGEIVGLVGHNGAGKSTLLKVLSGAHKQSGGTLRINGQRVEFASPSEAIDSGVSTVYQELSLLPNLTVAQNVWLGREPRRAPFSLDQAKMKKGAQELVDEFGIDVDVDRLVGSYPVAVRQLLEIAIASSRETKYLLLDEPTTALEGDQVTELLAYIRKIANERGIGVLIINHKLDELYGVADRIVALMNGKVLLDSSVESIDRHAVVAAIAGADHAERVEVQREKTSDHPVKMTVENLKGHLLNGVSFEARSSEILGIYGLGGSGRSECLRAIAGIDPATSGAIVMPDGERFLPKTPRESMKHRIAFLTEERKQDGIVPQMNSYLNASLPVLKKFSSFSYLNNKKLVESTDELLESTGIKGDPQSPITSLSGGNQQKVIIARALMQDPEILLLDEPSKGVDIGAKSDIHTLLRKLAHEDDRTVVMVSSEEEEILDVADRVLVFVGGQVVAGPLDAAELDIATLRTLAWHESDDDATNQTSHVYLAEGE